jgi:hypothetical protein
MNLFERYCALHGHKSYGAVPAIVAQFVADIAPIGIEQVWEALRDVSRMHYVHGLPDPTVGETVTAALNSIAKVDFPRWPKELRERFEMLPHEIQHWLARRQAHDDKLIRNLQRETAELRKANGIQITDTTAGTDRVDAGSEAA